MTDFGQWIAQAYPSHMKAYQEAQGPLAPWAETHLPADWPASFEAFYGAPYVSLADGEVLALTEDFQDHLAGSYLQARVGSVRYLVTDARNRPSGPAGDDLALALTDEAAIRAALWQQLAPQKSRPTTGERPVWLDLDQPAPGANIENLISQVLTAALAAEASDIHIEPGDRLLVRIRCQREMQTLCQLDRAYAESMINRLKLAGQMDIGEHILPLDGHFNIRYRQQLIDVRVASLATKNGEKLVLRLLPAIWQGRSLVSLGYRPERAAHLRQLVRSPHGLVILSGPTNSGKTTTLYTLLNELKNDGLVCYTIEDPVEIDLPGVNQIQVNLSRDLDFPRALRGVLRMDPDVILVGELRDAETAQIAVRAALTGHLVLTTLHAYDAHAVFHRLLDLGVSRDLIASVLLASQNQRLLLKKKTGDACQEGPTGRSGPGLAIVEECWVPDEADRAGIRAGLSGADLRRQALEKGFLPMEEDIALKLGMEILEGPAGQSSPGR